MADSYKTGLLAAEYLGSVVKGPAHVVIIGTTRWWSRASIKALTRRIPLLQIIELYESKQYPEKLFETLQEMLAKFSDIKGIYANNARTTIKISLLVHGLKEKRDLWVLGSELFSQSKKALEERILHFLDKEFHKDLKKRFS